MWVGCWWGLVVIDEQDEDGEGMEVSVVVLARNRPRSWCWCLGVVASEAKGRPSLRVLTVSVEARDEK
jgi:hypothetical protein